MGRAAERMRRNTQRTIRRQLLTETERAELLRVATYKGVPYHKRSPGDFGLTPPAAPRPDKTQCDEARVFKQAIAEDLLRRAIEGGLVSASTNADGYPRQMWVVDDSGQVFEAMQGGDDAGQYHGYPIRRSDPFHDEVTRRWDGRGD